MCNKWRAGGGKQSPEEEADNQLWQGSENYVMMHELKDQGED